MDNPEPTRDSNGRFAPGNPGGPGRSRGRGYELLRAAQEAVTPEHMTAMMRRALRMALEGNLSAMRFVAERTLGRPADAPAAGEPLDVSLPKLVGIDDCLAAIDRVNDAMVRGAITVEVAKAFLDMIQVRVKAIEVKDLEQRLTALEESASAVDLGGRRRF
ncbi:MAG: hypothetical protein KDE27_02960 [Planctomycetes bacterium]|nr:hypothetical protein [Planctomycetota bacterium]